VLLEATRGLRVGDQDVGVEHVGPGHSSTVPDQLPLAMTSYLELDSAVRVQTAPDYGDGATRDRFFSGGLLWGIRP
jgi:hypothetical protein